jgi:flagellar biosynthesis protein FlhA
MAILAMMVLPLPTLLLDMAFTFNISLALVVLMAAVYSQRPLDFAVFPTILLVATLMRLALNVASTRVVLLNGHTGPDAAGNVIKSFGDFVVGGNFAVGFVVFAILVIINFVVVTKGAGRISEVSARFTLDAMPGKQMAVDADLNAGIITQDEARLRRQEISQEADFYGAMDGASKFVRGDAIAGILILFINIIGGLVIGMSQHGMSIGDAARIFTLLTIGDGLVAQIPSLLLATASAIMVTRVSSAHNMDEMVFAQLFEDPRALAVTAAILTIMGLIPGMPNLAFLGMGAGAGYLAWRQKKRQEAAAAEPVEAELPAPEPTEETRELSWDDVVPVDPIGLEIGYRLIPMVDKAQDGQLLKRLRGVRKKLSQDLGFLVPSVHIRDNLDLAPTGYRISVHGATVAEATIHVDRVLAINPGQVYGEVEGLPGTDPVFNLPAVWITEDQRDEAQALGYTVVDASTVVATHLSQLIQDHAAELLGHEEAQKLLDNLANSHPKLVGELVPKVLPLSAVVRVLQNLLDEQVPLRDMRTILEVLSEHAPKSQDPDYLTTQVRAALGRLIIQEINGLGADLPVMTLDYRLEQILQKSLQAGSGDGVLDPNLVQGLMNGLKDAHDNNQSLGQPSILLVSDAVRSFVAKLAKPRIQGLHVIGMNEVPADKDLRVTAAIGAADPSQGAA